MLLHCIGEHLLLRSHWNVDKLRDAGIPIPMRLRVVDKLVTELHLDSQWFYALSYITDPEYFLMVINQIKYLWFLNSARQLKDKGAISNLFDIVHDLCIQYLQKEEHRTLFVDLREKVREKCEKLLEYISTPNKDCSENKIIKLWKDEQNKTAQSLSATLTKCYLRFKTSLEKMWEESKGYPATKGNDCSMKLSVVPEGCKILLEEVESLTQHAPHLVPLSREEMLQAQTTSTPGRSKWLSDVTSSTIPPFQLPPSAMRARQVDLVAGPDVATADLVPSRHPSSSSSRKSEELVSSSQGDSLFGEADTGQKSSVSAEQNVGTAQPHFDLMFKRMTELEKRVDDFLKTRKGQDGHIEDNELRDELSAPLMPVSVRSFRNSLEEPLPETLETVSSTTSHRLNILLEDLDLLDTEEMKVVSKDDGVGKMDENKEDHPLPAARESNHVESTHEEIVVEKDKVRSSNLEKLEKKKPTLMSEIIPEEMPPEKTVIQTRSKRKLKSKLNAEPQKGTENVILIPDGGQKARKPSEPNAVVDQHTRKPREKRPRHQGKDDEPAGPREGANNRKKSSTSRGRPRKEIKVGRAKYTKPAKGEDRPAVTLVSRDHAVFSTASLNSQPNGKDPVIRLRNMKWCSSRSRPTKVADKPAPSEGQEPLIPGSGAASFIATDVPTSSKKDDSDKSDGFVDKVPHFTSTEYPSLLPPTIERTSETKPRCEPRYPSRQPRRTMLRRSAETTILVSEDEDSLPDPELSIDHMECLDSSDVSLIPL